MPSDRSSVYVAANSSTLADTLPRLLVRIFVSAVAAMLYWSQMTASVISSKKKAPKKTSAKKGGDAGDRGQAEERRG